MARICSKARALAASAIYKSTEKGKASAADSQRRYRAKRKSLLKPLNDV